MRDCARSSESDPARGWNEGEQVSTGLVSVWESSQEKAFLRFFDASLGSL